MVKLQQIKYINHAQVPKSQRLKLKVSNQNQLVLIALASKLLQQL